MKLREEYSMRLIGTRKEVELQQGQYGTASVFFPAAMFVNKGVTKKRSWTNVKGWVCLFGTRPVCGDKARMADEWIGRTRLEDVLGGGLGMNGI